MASLGHEKLSGKVVEFLRKLKKLGQDDPRRIVHSLKIGLAITLVSLFYYFKPLYNGFGVAAMWAVLTVVVVFEFSVGATLGRGLNRMFATLLAGGLGIGAHHLASLAGETGEPIFIAVFVFVIAAIVSFFRFIPKMKAKYDYGLMMFILTFCLVSVSGYRDDKVIHMAFRRLTTIMIGSATSVLICILICPVWIGVELHNLVAGNLDKLGNFLEGFADEYFEIPGSEKSADKSFLEGYRNVLTSKSNEESMANLARWEPRHGRFKFRHPWKQYLKVANLSRQCAYKIETLHTYLKSEFQTPMQDRAKIHEPCKVISTSCGKALKELAATIKKMTKSSSHAGPHIVESRAAAGNLKAVLKSGIWRDSDLLEITPAAAVASLLLEIDSCIEEIVAAVGELESLARFKSEKPRVAPDCGAQPPQRLDVVVESVHDHVITVDANLSQPCLKRNLSKVQAEGSHVKSTI